jgi:hypothetical protein
MFNPYTLHADAATLETRRAAWTDRASIDSKEGARAFVRDLQAIAAAKPELATFHTTPAGVSVAWHVAGGVIVRPLRGLSGEIAGAITLSGDVLAMLAKLAAKLAADGMTDLVLSTRLPDGRAWVPVGYGHPAPEHAEQWKQDGCPPATHVRRAPLTLRAGRFTANLNSERATAVAMPSPGIAWTIAAVDVDGFRGALASVLEIAKSADSTRSYLQAVHLCTDDAGLYLQASDGHRIHTARAASQCDSIYGNGPACGLSRQNGCVLSLEQAKALAGQLKTASTLKIGFSSDAGKVWLCFGVDDDGQTMRFSDPDYGPEAREIRARFDTCYGAGESCEFTATAKDLKAALAAVLVGKGDGRARYVRLCVDAGLVELQSSAGINGSASRADIAERTDQSHECRADACGSGVVALNSVHLAAALANVAPGATVTVVMFQNTVAVFSPRHATTIITVRDSQQTAPEGQHRNALDMARDHAAEWAWSQMDRAATPIPNQPAPIVSNPKPQSAQVLPMPQSARRIPARFAGASSVAVLIAA